VRYRACSAPGIAVLGTTAGVVAMTGQADSDGGTAAGQIAVFLLDDHEVVRRGLFAKLGMERRTQAAAYAARLSSDSAK
jgi:hypothetical protein